MSLLSYDRERVRADLHAGALADIAERLYRWNPTEDNEGLALACNLVNALGDDGIPRWSLDLDPATVVVLAHFSCRDNGLLTYDGDLTVSMLIDGSFEIGDPGISSLDELVEFTAEQDGPARVLTVLDAITARLKYRSDSSVAIRPSLEHPQAPNGPPTGDEISNPPYTCPQHRRHRCAIAP